MKRTHIGSFVLGTALALGTSSTLLAQYPQGERYPDPPHTTSPAEEQEPKTPAAPEEMQRAPEPARTMQRENDADVPAAAAPDEKPRHADAQPLEDTERDGPKHGNGTSAEEARRRAEAGAAIPDSDTHPAHLFGAAVAAQAQAAEAAAKEALVNEMGASIRQQGGEPQAQEAPATNQPRVFVDPRGFRFVYHADGRFELISPDGGVYTESADKGHKTYTSPTGDRNSTYPDQSEVRYSASTRNIEVRYPDGENGFVQKPDGTRTALPSGSFPNHITPLIPVPTQASLLSSVKDALNAIPNPLDYVPNPTQAAKAAGGVFKGAFDALCGVGHAAGAVVVGGTAQWCGADPNGYFGAAMRDLDKLAGGMVSVADDPTLVYRAPAQAFDQAIDRGDAFGAGKVAGETGTNAVIVADAVVNLSGAAIGTVRGTAAAETATAAATRLNVVGEVGPGVTRSHLAAVQQLANQTGQKIIILGSRQTGIRSSTGGPFTAASDLDLGVVGGADNMMALVRAEQAVTAVPDVAHGVMALQPTVEAAVAKGWIVVLPEAAEGTAAAGNGVTSAAGAVVPR